MSHHINKAEQQFILREMLELARYLISRSVPPPQITKAVKRLRDDLITLIRAGSTEITVDRASYLETFPGQQWGGRTHAAGGRVLDERTWDEMPPERLGPAVHEQQTLV